MADLKHYERYGWKCSEENLKTLPKTAPQEAHALTEWLTLQGRKTSLEEWLGCVEEDGKIHGKFWHIGAWTHRMSHSKPNNANIPAVYFLGDYHPKEDEDTGEWIVQVGTERRFKTYEEAFSFAYKLWGSKGQTDVDRVKAKYDGEMRSCFHVSSGSWLVGCDAAGIQLRILAHYMKSVAYVEAIVNGEKRLETDIHNLNRQSLGKVCRDRDVAKTFIYAWLLGAGITKVASILDCSIPQAKTAMDNFFAAIPELNFLKTITIPHDAAIGFFKGLDGRKIPCVSEHYMLAGYLQAGESVIMKKATVIWHKKFKHLKMPAKMVNYVHDEWQVKVTGSKDLAHKAGRIMCKAIEQAGEELNLFCPLEGEYKIGRDWCQTH